MNVGNQNTQQVEQNPVNQPATTPENPKTKYLLISGIVLACFLVFGVGGYYLGKQSSDESQNLKQNSSQTTPYSTPTNTINSPLPTKLLSADTFLPHEYLPDFNITYSEQWSISKIKQFRDEDPQGFVSNYFPTCHGRCMGIRLSKSNVSLDLLFDVAFDSNGLKCSNSVAYQPIGNGWYRVKDSSSYFYTNTVEVNKTLENGRFPSPFGKTTDEWSAVADTTYKICVQGSGDFLNQYSKVEVGETGEGVPILMEFPTVKGNPDTTTLLELDDMISSIKGFK